MTNWIRLAKLFISGNKIIFPILFLTTLTLFGLAIILPTYKDCGGVKVATPNMANSSPTTMKLGRDILRAKILFNRQIVLMTHRHFQFMTSSSF